MIDLIIQALDHLAHLLQCVKSGVVHGLRRQLYSSMPERVTDIICWLIVHLKRADALVEHAVEDLVENHLRQSGPDQL